MRQSVSEFDPRMDFTGQTVLVTGSSSGIGAAIARGFAGAGATVAIHFHTGEDRAIALTRSLTSLGASVEAFGADLGKRGDGDRLVGAVIKRFGSLDVLVNNAGSLIRRVPSAEIDDAYFDAIVDANLYSTVSCCRAAIPHMVERRHGAIVNMSSVAARHGGGAGAVLYAAAKAAVATWTRGLAKELAPHGIRVNAISPGVVDTPFHDRFTSPESFQTFVRTIPLGRAASVDEIVGPTMFLASDQLSSHITGQVLEVNGGMLSP